ncbi:efflux RND transporter periplasmic adaptor subunit [Motilimonas sp. KMU-193]|uniref:efflux RND transporter periplasmic adaptor subunit n=1 Tax=Motilimonas sp. KMU-193 TaxID=3388668 RepID=UPI00396B3440
MKLTKCATLILTCLSLMACQEVSIQQKPPAMVAVYQIPQADQKVERVFNAVARAQELTKLAFRVDGKIANILVTNGQQVKQGDLLAVLDKRDYEVNLSDRRARMQSTYNQFQRAQKMLDKKLMAQSEYDQMRAQYLVAKAEHRSAELQLSYTELRAPFDGLISNVALDSFVNIQPGTEVLTMHKIEFIEVDVQVPDSLLAVSKRKEYDEQRRQYKVVFDAYPEQTFTGTTLEVNTEKDPATKTYIVTLQVPLNAQYPVLEGMPAQVEVDLNDATYTYSRAQTIPLSAVAMLDGDKLAEQKASVWIYNADSQTVSARQVTLGVITGSMIEVTQGLNAGDTIIASGVNRLVEGQTVELRKG